MVHSLYALLATARSSLKPQRELVLENLALRQQLAILKRKTKRPKLTQADRAFWVALCRLWPDWRNALILVKPETVIGWHRKGSRLYRSWKSRKRGGRPPIEQQLVNAFPYDSAPKYVIRDRDKIYGADFARRVRAMGIEQVLTAPSSPWKNPYCERGIGTLRRDCLDHVIVVGEQHLRRILRKYLAYYHGSRTRLALGKDAPEPRKRESTDGGNVIALPMVGGLHHRYTRCAA